MERTLVNLDGIVAMLKGISDNLAETGAENLAKYMGKAENPHGYTEDFLKGAIAEGGRALLLVELAIDFLTSEETE